ncbi:RBBP9/YdeN family alpha/beta hydrolase [Microbacterium sp.]|uniref:RBBP9/YdeN family alpha/beta hydrolase n=1 Tax=Microbacterium sp. TaxID=51671 RepID=UPI003C762D8C
MSLERLVIVHGYHASPSSHWFAWLADEVVRDGVRVAIPALPEPTSPDLEGWITTVADAIGTPDDGLTVVAHSLGAITVLHALGRLAGDWSLGAFVVVSGFADSLPALPELDGFTADPPDIERLAERIRQRTVIASDNDTIVPPAASHALGRRLDAQLVTVPGAGHFLADDGYTTLPAVLHPVTRPA